METDAGWKRSNEAENVGSAMTRDEEHSHVGHLHLEYMIWIESRAAALTTAPECSQDQMKGVLDGGGRKGQEIH